MSGWRHDGNPQQAPRCWDCQHYQRRHVDERMHEHRCGIARSGFPTSGDRCPAYLYEPGADAAEFAFMKG